MRKALATVAMTVGALGVSAGAASADPVIDDNQHGNLEGDGVNVALDVLTSADILEHVNVLGDGVNVGDIDAT